MDNQDWQVFVQRFHFNLRTALCIVEDVEGEILPGLDEAFVEAAHIARDHVCAELRRGMPISLNGSVDIIAAEGDVRARVSFADAISRNMLSERRGKVS